MNSIGNKIRLALIGSISVIAIVAGIILAINQLNVLQNQRIIQTMTMEYTVYSLSEELIRLYNEVIKNPGNAEYISQYDATHKKLTDTITTLKKQITQKDSKILMLGVEHTANQVINECDTGLSEIKNNNFQNFSEHFASAHKYNSFVLENTRTLVQKELEHLSRVQEQSQRNYIGTIVVSVSLFILVFLVMIFYSHAFTRQLITPLSQLSVYAKAIATGNLETQSKRNLTIENDEIGSLTQSVYSMVDKLIQMISQEKQTSDAMKKTSESLANSNQELQRMNTLMTGRELKMIELKKEIEELKTKLPHN